MYTRMELEEPMVNVDIINKEGPQLATVLNEMKAGLDIVTAKVQSLTAKVRENHFPTADGISYLEAKHLLLLTYCQSLVYYLIRKAKGLSIEGHPVVKNLVEIRLFLEKIRPIDKKMQYQIQKLTRATAGGDDKVDYGDKEEHVASKTEDDLDFRPNPDMLISKSNPTLKDGDGGGFYQPPRIAPTAMEETKTSKQERDILRKNKRTLQQAKQSTYTRDLIDEIEGRPEEIIEFVGAESKEVSRYKDQFEDRLRREEKNFARTPLTKVEKKKLKGLRKSSNGLLGLTDGFNDEIKSLPLGENDDNEIAGFNSGSGRDRTFKKRKRKY